MSAPLSPKAILEGRSTNRPPVMVIVGLVVSGFCALLMMGFYLIMKGVLSTAVGVLFAIPTAVVLIALVLLIDRLEPEPPLNLVLAVAWGAGVSIVGAMILNTSIGWVLSAELVDGWARFYTASFVAPIVEESLKGSLLLVLLLVRRNEIDGPTDGIVYAALSGIGFALVENILYYTRYMAQDQLLMTVLMRGVFSPLCHPLFTSMIGLGVAYAATRRGVAGVFAIIGGWIAAVVLHGLWNGSSFIAYLNGLPPITGIAFAWIVLFFVLIGLIVIIIRDRRRTIRLIQTHLPAYIPSGLVQPHDVRMLGSMSGRKQARKWARSSAGLRGARAMGDYQLAATELGLLHKHAANTAIPPDKFYARRDAILFLMRKARESFLQRVPQAPPAPWAHGQQSGFFAAPAAMGPLPQYQPQYQPQGPGMPPPPQRPMPQPQMPARPPQQPQPPMPPPQQPPAWGQPLGPPQGRQPGPPQGPPPGPPPGPPRW